MIILLVDDHTLLRQSLIKALLSKQSDMIFIEAGNSAEAIKYLEGADIVILDLVLENNESGLDLLKEIKKLRPDIKTLIISMHSELFYVNEAIKGGVQGYVTKDSPVESLLEAINTVYKGGSWFSQNVSALMSQIINGNLSKVIANGNTDCFSEYNSLTRREQEIFSLLANGKTISEIAKKLNLSSKTIENHRSNLYQKLGLSDRYEVFTYARRLGLIF